MAEDHNQHQMTSPGDTGYSHNQEARVDQIPDQNNSHQHHADHTGHEQMFRRRFWLP